MCSLILGKFRIPGPPRIPPGSAWPKQATLGCLEANFPNSSLAYGYKILCCGCKIETAMSCRLYRGHYSDFIQQIFALYIADIQIVQIGEYQIWEKIMKIVSNQVHMARFGPIIAQNRSHRLWGASGMPPGPQNTPKIKKSRVWGV